MSNDLEIAMTLTDSRPRHRLRDEPRPSSSDATAEHTGTRPLGALVGAAGGAAAGALGGLAAGPVGSLAGSMVGAVLGATGGSARSLGIGPSVGAPADAVPSDDSAPPRSGITPSPHPKPAIDDHDDPAVRYGVQAYVHYRGACDWSDVEVELSEGWKAARGNSTLGWDEAEPIAHAAWLRSRDVAKHTLAHDSPDQGLQYRAATEPH
jgi:hypothetical protein